MALVIYLGVHAFHAAPEEALQQKHGGLVPISQVNNTLTQPVDDILYSVLENMAQETAENLQQWITNGNISHCTLAYPLPMPYIAGRMAKGTPPETAAKDWQSQAELLLELFKKNRRRVSLIAYALAEQTYPDTASSINIAVPLPYIAPVYQLAAQRLIQQTPRLATTASYLLASTQNAKEVQTLPLPDISKVLAEHRQLESVQSQHQNLEEENTLLLEQLHLVQEEHEGQLVAHTAHQQTHAKLKQQHDTAVKALETAQAQQTDQSRQQSQERLQEVEEENSLLLEQLHLVQEEFERQLLARQRMENSHQVASQAYTQEMDAQKALAQWLRASAAQAAKEAHSANKTTKRRLLRHLKQLASSELFDTDWYLAQYPDVANGTMSPAEHYLKHGAMEGRNPSAHFDSLHYITAYPDVAETGINPLIHYLNHGQVEQREPTPNGARA